MGDLEIVCVKGRGVGSLRGVEGWAFLNAGEGRGALAVGSVRVQNHKNGKELEQSLMRTLVDCYFVHFKYLGYWCIGTVCVCEENDTESD